MLISALVLSCVQEKLGVPICCHDLVPKVDDADMSSDIVSALIKRMNNSFILSAGF
jgi:hypothetical protein